MGAGRLQAGRARSAAVGGGRGAGRRPRCSQGGLPHHRPRALDHQSRRGRPRRGTAAGWPRAAQGRRRQAVERARSDACRRPQAAGRAGDAGLARAAVAVGVEEPREAGAGAERDGAQDQREHGRQAAHGRAGLLAPGEPQGGRRLAPSRPQCAVRAHQRESRCGAGQRRARHLGRYQEEGAGRQLQERRLRLSPAGPAGPRQRARFRRQGAGQGGALRRLRRGGQRGLRQCRHHRGHGRVCRRGDPHVARAHGPSALSEA